MINNNKIVVVLPAYNSGKTLKKTYDEIPFEIVDEVILTDDYSNDNTVEVAKEIGIEHIIKHDSNLGYGGNQKTCYKKALIQNILIAQIAYKGYDIAEITCPTHYSSETSSINFGRSVKYGLGVVNTSFQYFFSKRLKIPVKLFKEE